MSEWSVKRGNTSVQDVLVKDKDGNLITDLADAQTIVFQVKEKKPNTTPKITKTKGDGIQVNIPSTGYLRITLLPSETNLTVKKYFMGLEIKWSADVIYETIIEINGIETDVFRIRQDVVK